MSSELRRKSVNEVAVTQYDISVIPNDFNITTIFNLIDSGAVEMLSLIHILISTRGIKEDAFRYGELVFDVNSAYFYNHGGYDLSLIHISLH